MLACILKKALLKYRMKQGAKSVYRLLKYCVIILILGCSTFTAHPCYAGGAAKVVMKAVKAFKSGKTATGLSKGVYAGTRLHRQYKDWNKKSVSSEDDGSVHDESPDREEGGKSSCWPLVIFLLLAFGLLFGALYLLYRYVWVPCRNWFERHRESWYVRALRLLLKKPVIITLLVIACLLSGYAYVMMNKLPFAAFWLEQALSEPWPEPAEDSSAVFANGEFQGVHILESGYCFNDDWLSFPFVPENDNQGRSDLFFSNQYYKSVAYGRVMRISVHRELRASVARAIWEENDRQGLVRRAMHETLSLIGEPYRSNGWYWDDIGQHFVIGANNAEEERERVCVQISCSTVIEDGKRKSYINLCLTSSDFLTEACLGRAVEGSRSVFRRSHMYKEAERRRISFERLTKEKLTDVFGINLGDVVQGDELTKTKDGAIHSTIKIEPQILGFDSCDVYALPVSLSIFRIEAVGAFKYKREALSFYEQVEDYFQDKFNRRFCDELRGKPCRAYMWPNIMILKRDSIEFAENRILTIECSQDKSGETNVAIYAVDYSSQKLLQKEVADLINKQTAVHEEEVAQ